MAAFQFTKEQLEMAKGLQSGYQSSGTFKATATATATTTASRSVASQRGGRQATASMPARPPPHLQSRTQAGSALRTVNGLKRPIPSNASPGYASIPPTRTVAPASCVQPVSKHPAKTAPTAASQPTLIHTPAQAPAPQLNQASSLPPMQAFQTPASKLAAQAAVQAAVQSGADENIPPRKKLLTPVDTHQASDLLSLDQPVPALKTPTMVATPVFQDVEMGNTEFNTAPQAQERHAPVVASEAPNVGTTGHVTKASAETLKAIEMVRQGIPFKWYHMSGAPEVREVTEEEKRGLAPLPPPGPVEKLPWQRPEPQRVGVNQFEAEGPPSTKPIIGLRGSRHA